MKQKTAPKVKAPRKKVNIPWGLVIWSTVLIGNIVGVVLFYINIMNTVKSGSESYSPVPGTDDYIEQVSSVSTVGGWVGVIFFTGIAFGSLIALLTVIADGNLSDIEISPTVVVTVIGFGLGALLAIAAQSNGISQGFPVENAMIVYGEDGLTMEESVKKDLQFDSDSTTKEVFLAQRSDEGTYYYKYLGVGEELLAEESAN